ncbi:MAG: DoxX family protein [Acidobacteriota bacterium]
MNLTKLLYPSHPDTPVSGGLLFLRLIAGFGMFLHGFPKMLNPFGWMPPEAPIPGILQFFAAFTECFGGLALMLGALTVPASIGIAGTMVVAALIGHVVPGDPFVRLFAEEGATLPGIPAFIATGGQGGSYELALLYLGITVVLALVGPGRLSLDHRFFGRS